MSGGVVVYSHVCVCVEVQGRPQLSCLNHFRVHCIQYNPYFLSLKNRTFSFYIGSTVWVPRLNSGVQA